MNPNKDKSIPACMKKCSKCGEVIGRWEFMKRRRTLDGLSTWCTMCKHGQRFSRVERYKNYRIENKEKLRKKNRDYYNKNKGMESARKRKWYMAKQIGITTKEFPEDLILLDTAIKAAKRELRNKTF